MTEQRMVDVELLREVMVADASETYHQAINKLRDIIASPNEGWQPIETAPKDRSIRLTNIEYSGKYIGRWDDQYEHWAIDVVGVTGKFADPTHWAELAAEPALPPRRTK